MSRKDIASRNRRNAQKSTGPKTKEGKTKVSQNALSHGATARPNPESVSVWLRVIMNDPEVSLEGVEEGGDTAFRALVLAEAEVQLKMAETALEEFEDHARRRDKERKRLLRAGAIWLGGVLQGRNNPTKELVELSRLDPKEFTAEKRTRSLLKRYASEAKSKRRKAFRAWLHTTKTD